MLFISKDLQAADLKKQSDPMNFTSYLSNKAAINERFKILRFLFILTFGKAVEECHTQKIFQMYGKGKIKRASKTEALHSRQWNRYI
jgi:hypothetical protein